MTSQPIRKTRRRYENPGECRFLTFSCYHRMRLFDNDAIKDAFLEQIDSARRATGFRLIGHVIMPEHVHLMIVPALPEAPVARVLRVLKGAFAHRVIARWKELDAPVLMKIADAHGAQRFWQPGGGYDRNIHSDDEFFEKLEYMHTNPVKRGLVTQPTDWRWSSARWYAGMRGDSLRLDAIA